MRDQNTRTPVVLSLTDTNPAGRLDTLRQLSVFGPSVEVMSRPDVDLRGGKSVPAIKAAIVETEADGNNVVVGIIPPRPFLADIGSPNNIRGEGDSSGPPVVVLWEDFARDEGGRVVPVGQDERGRDILQVTAYKCLVGAEAQFEPIQDSSLPTKTNNVLVVSRHKGTKNRQEVIDAAGGCPMTLHIADVPFKVIPRGAPEGTPTEWRPRQAIEDTITQLGGVAMVVVSYGVCRELKFGDAFGRDVVIAVEENVQDPTTKQAFVVGKEEGTGRDVFQVERIVRFRKNELVLGDMEIAPQA